METLSIFGGEGDFEEEFVGFLAVDFFNGKSEFFAQKRKDVLVEIDRGTKVFTGVLFDEFVEEGGVVLVAASENFEEDAKAIFEVFTGPKGDRVLVEKFEQFAVIVLTAFEVTALIEGFVAEGEVGLEGEVLVKSAERKAFGMESVE